MLKIGDFSKLSRISIRMLRHYDENGLLHPAYVDAETGYRYYNVSQLQEANRIQLLKNMGLSLQLIYQINIACDEEESLKKYLQLHYSQLQEQAENLQQKLQLTKTTIERIGKDDLIMKFDVAIKNFPSMKVMSLRKTIPSYEQEGTLWQQMYKEMEGKKILFSEPCYSMAVFHDEGFKDSDVDVEIQTTVKEEYSNLNEVKFKVTEPVKTVTVILKGNYECISDACAAVAQWVNDNQYTFCGPMFNIYHVSPGMEENPEKWVTEVCFPIK